MKLENLKPLYRQFDIDKFHFKSEDFDHEHIVFGVYDAGRLKVGEFDVEFTDDGDFEFSDSSSFPNTLELLRNAGISDILTRNVKKSVDSILN